MSTKLKFGGLLLCLFSTLITLQGQNTSEILVYDLQTKSLDTLSSFRYDVKIKTDHTKHFCGDEKTANLKQEVPKSNLVEDTKFTNLIPLASMESDLAFPYTTSVKIVLPDSGDKHQASGVMVGDRFVLTAGHSVLKKYTNAASFDKIDVIAAYDHVLSSNEELRSAVSKIYFVKDWRIGEGEDVVLLELKDAIGSRSGWMSIGFEDENKLVGNLYHKLSYPAYNTPFNKKPYTGDDLHLSYGVADYISPEFIGVQNHLVGLGGESGSPIFSTDNKDEYITYGVLTFLGNYNHTRLRPSIYYAFEDILEGTGSKSVKVEKEPKFDINVYPNPATDYLIIDAKKEIEGHVDLMIYNATGKIITTQKLESSNRIDTRGLQKGLYHILLHDQEVKESFSFVVQ